MPGNGEPPRLRRILQLAVITFGGDQMPAIVDQPAQPVADFHQPVSDPFTVPQFRSKRKGAHDEAKETSRYSTWNTVQLMRIIRLTRRGDDPSFWLYDDRPGRRSGVWSARRPDGRICLARLMPNRVRCAVHHAGSPTERSEVTGPSDRPVPTSSSATPVPTGSAPCASPTSSKPRASPSGSTARASLGDQLNRRDRRGDPAVRRTGPSRPRLD